MKYHTIPVSTSTNLQSLLNALYNSSLNTPWPNYNNWVFAGFISNHLVFQVTDIENTLPARKYHALTINSSANVDSFLAQQSSLGRVFKGAGTGHMIFEERSPGSNTDAGIYKSETVDFNYAQEFFNQMVNSGWYYVGTGANRLIFGYSGFPSTYYHLTTINISANPTVYFSQKAAQQLFFVGTAANKLVFVNYDPWSGWPYIL